MLSACCCCYLLFGLLGCAPSKIKTRISKKSYVRMKMNTASHRHPGKSSYPLPQKKTLSARHALNTARIAPRPRPQCSDGLPLQNPFGFCSNSARAKRYDRKQTKNSHLPLYISYDWKLEVQQGKKKKKKRGGT